MLVQHHSQRSNVLSKTTNSNNTIRTSSLMAPTMELQGHRGEIFASDFSKDGTFFASAGYDMQIFLWNVYETCDNFAVLRGHKGAIMNIKFNPDSSHLVSGSTDKTIRVWDMETGVCLRNFKSHSDFVNSVDVTRRGVEMITSASDDGSILIHDLRSKQAVKKYENKYQQTSVVFSDNSDQIMCGGIDNKIKIWDMRRDVVTFELNGHRDTITGLSLSNNGNYLLSNSMDCTLNTWDVRAFVAGERLLATYTGHVHNFEKNLLRCAWSPCDKHITAGSADRFAYVWQISTRKILYRLPGHLGSINTTNFHPKEPILLSAGSDKRILLGEIDLEDY